MSRELTEKQLWLLRMLFEEFEGEIIDATISRYAKDNATNISHRRDKRGGLQSRLKGKIGDGEIKAEPAVLQVAEGERINEPIRSRRGKGKSEKN